MLFKSWPVFHNIIVTHNISYKLPYKVFTLWLFLFAPQHKSNTQTRLPDKNTHPVSSMWIYSSMKGVEYTKTTTILKPKQTEVWAFPHCYSCLESVFQLSHLRIYLFYSTLKITVFTVTSHFALVQNHSLPRVRNPEIVKRMTGGWTSCVWGEREAERERALLK